MVMEFMAPSRAARLVSRSIRNQCISESLSVQVPFCPRIAQSRYGGPWTAAAMVGLGGGIPVQDAEVASRRGPPGFDIVVVAASAGGLVALVGVLAALPREFPLPIAV